MRNLLLRLQEFYADHKELTIAIGGIVAGWLLTKCLPYLFHQVGRGLASVGRLLGGRLSYKSIQETYLNWVVLNNQDLNLTGIVGVGDKPQLEQVFVSLKIVEEFEKPPTDEELQDVSPTSFWDTLILAIREFAFRANRKTERTDESSLYRASRFWRIRQLFDHEQIAIGTALVILSVFFIAVPTLLLIPSDISSFRVAFGMSLALLPLALIIGLEIQDHAYFNLRIFLFICTAAAVPVYGLIKTMFFGLDIIGTIIALVICGLVVLAMARSGERMINRRERAAREIGGLLSAENRIAILGKPGAGKSTYVQFLALTFAQEKAGEKKLRRRGIVKKRFGKGEWLLPLPIPLRKTGRFITEASSPSYDGVNLLIEAFKKKVLPSNVSAHLSDSYLKHMLSKGRCLILLDGLDEVADDDQFQAVTREIMGLVSRYPQNKFLITSRFSGWRGGLGSSFKQFQIDDLAESQINEFIDSWYQAIEENRLSSRAKGSAAERLFYRKRAEENSDRLKKGLRITERIRRLAENPLLLSIICFVHYHKTLPKERLSLYRDCSNLLLDQWDQEKGLPVDDTNLSLARKEAIMQEIAFALHSGMIGRDYGRKEATEDEIVPIVSKTLSSFKMDTDQAATLFKKLIDRSGIIVTVEKFNKRYAFSHLTFQEYYTAAYLHQNEIDIFHCLGLLHGESEETLTTWWREALLLFSAMQKDPSGIIRQLIVDNEGDLLKRRLQIAAQSFLEAVQVSDPAIEAELLRKLLYVRSGGARDRPAQPLSAEVASYLLAFAASPRFYKFVISLAIGPARSKHLKNVIIPQLLDMTKSVDRELQLAATDALVQLVSRSEKEIRKHAARILRLLDTPSADVQLAALGLIAKILRPPVAASTSQKLVRVLAQLLVSLRPRREYTLHLTFDSKFRSSGDGRINITAISDVLEQTIHLVSRQHHDELRRTLIETLRDGGVFFKFHSFSGLLGVDEEFYRSVARTLRALDDESQQAEHKRQLFLAVSKGTESDQERALHLIAYMFGDCRESRDVIVRALRSRYSGARSEALAMLPKLPLTTVEVAQCEKTLLTALERKSAWVIASAAVKAIAFGRGALDVRQKNLIASALLSFHLHDQTNDEDIAARIREAPDEALLLMHGMGRADLSESDNRNRLLKEALAQVLDNHPVTLVSLIAQVPSLSRRLDFSQKVALITHITNDVSDKDRPAPLSTADLRTLKALEAPVIANSDLHKNLVAALSTKTSLEADLAFDLLWRNNLI